MGVHSTIASVTLEFMQAAVSRQRAYLRAALRDSDWRSARVYFLAFLNPSQGQPVPTLTARLASLCHGR
jgi:hypothetical protein